MHPDISQLEFLINLSDDDLIKKNQENVADKTYSKNANQKHYEALFNNYKNNLDQKLDLKECCCCHRLITVSKSKLLDSKENYYLKNKNFINNSDSSIFICREHCYKSIFKEGKIPIYSKLNNMQILNQPTELSILNFYEKLLIQRAKCFVTIIKLNSYSKNNSGYQTVALKGLAVHLLINFESTHGYIIDSLPCSDTLNIIIHGLPTGNNNIWRGLVNLEKVYTALEWLKINNKLYRDININRYLPTYKYFNNIIYKRDINNNTKISYLKQLKENMISHYTIIDFDKINENISDIEKYKMKKVVTKALNDKDKNMDHLCFVDIFPFGI